MAEYSIRIEVNEIVGRDTDSVYAQTKDECAVIFKSIGEAQRVFALQKALLEVIAKLSRPIGESV